MNNNSPEVVSKATRVSVHMAYRFDFYRSFLTIREDCSGGIREELYDTITFYHPSIHRMYMDIRQTLVEVML